MGGIGWDQIRSIAVDSKGNSYITAGFSDTVMFGVLAWGITTDPSGKITITESLSGPTSFGHIGVGHSGGNQAFIAMYDPQGSCL